MGNSAKRKKDAAFAAGTVVLADAMRRDAPGQWTDNRLEQAQHYRGVIYIAIRALMDALLASTVQINRKHRRYHTTSLRRQEKALPTPRANTEDEQFRPFDDPDHSLVKLVDRPNRTETFNELLAQMVMQYHLTGSALLWANPGERIPVPRELYVLPTALCYPQPPQPNYPEGWWRVAQFYPAGGFGILPSPIAGGGAPVDGRDVFVFKNPHPLWRWDAYSPLTGGGVQLDILESIDQARWTAMDMGLTPDMVLLAPGVNQNQLDVYLERLKHTNIGKRNFRKVMAIGGDQGDSKFDVKFPTTTAKDMDFASGWDQMTAFALALFGVPKSVAGLATTGSYAELYAAIKQFHTLTLRPLVSRLGVWFTRHLARIWGDDLAIQLDLPTIDDQQLQEQQISTDLAHDLITYNEARAIRGRKPVPGGDVIPSVYVQSQQAKAQAQQQASQPQPAQGQPGDPQQQAAQPLSPNGMPQPGGGDPLSQLLGTAAPGGDDGHVQNAVADAALGALGVPAGGGADREHPDGDRWKGPSGQWFRMDGNHVVPTDPPGTVKDYGPRHLKARNPNAPVGKKPKPIGTSTGTPPDAPNRVPAASDSLSKSEEKNRDPGEVYPTDRGAVRQQTQSDTSAPAAKPQPAKQYGAGYQPPQTTPTRLSRADSDKFPSAESLAQAPAPDGVPTVNPTPAPSKPVSPLPPPPPVVRPVATQAPGGATPGPFQHRQEGERFQGPSGHWFEMRNKLPVPIAIPTSGAAVQGSPTSNVTLKPTAVQQWFGALPPDHQAKVFQWVDSVRTGKPGARPPAADASEQMIMDQLGREAAQTGRLPPYMARQLGLPASVTSPVTPAVQAPASSRAQAARAAVGKNAPPVDVVDHRSLMQWIANTPQAQQSGLTLDVMERMKPNAVRQIGAGLGAKLPPEEPLRAAETIPIVQPVAPKEHITALVNAGQLPPAESFAEAARSVPTPTPQSQAALANVGSWVGPLADRHADRVAAHFGIDRARATRLLTHAITAIAQHAAAKGDPNSPSASVSIAQRAGGADPLTVRLHPRTVAARQTVGDMVEHIRGGHDLSPKHAGEFVRAVEHLPPDEVRQTANVIKLNMTVAEKRETDQLIAHAVKAAAALAAAGIVPGPAVAAEPAQSAPTMGAERPAIFAKAPARPDMRNPLAAPAAAVQQPPPPNDPRTAAGAAPEGDGSVPPVPPMPATFKPGDKLRPHFEVSAHLTPEQQWHEQHAQQYAEDNYDAIKRKYLAENATPADSGSGFKSIVLNTDEWRHHLPGYTGYNAFAVHEAASSLNKRLLNEALESQKGKGNGKQFVLAGGGGSGKGTLTNSFFKQAEYPIVLDQVSGNFEKLTKSLDKAAKEHGYKPVYSFVDRAPDQAFGNGVVRRAVTLDKAGKLPRTVEIKRALEDNVLARQVALRMIRERHDIPAHVMYMDDGGNPHMITDRAEAERFLTRRLEEAQKFLAEGGEDSLAQQVVDRHRAGEIRRPIAEGLIGRDRLSRLLGEGDGRSGVPEPGQVAADAQAGADAGAAADAGRVPPRRTGGTGTGRQAVNDPAAAAGGVAQEDRPLAAVTARDPNAVAGQPPPKDKPVTLMFGGSFSPGHTGHITTGALVAKKHLEDQGYTVGKVVIAPSADKLLRDKLGNELIPIEHRAEMLNRTLRGMGVEGIEASAEPGQEAEAFQGKLKRTQLADWAARKYPGTTIVNATGEDAVPPGAPGHSPAIFAGGAGTSHDGYYYVTVPRDTSAAADISSSKIRKLVKEGKPLPEGWMHPEAEAYYRQHLKDRAGADDYVEQAMRNFRNTSRTASGFVDTSASKEKADKIVDQPADKRAALANDNFERTIRELHARRNEKFTPESVAKLVDDVNASVNRGITKEGTLLRTDNSPKHPYADVQHLPELRRRFAAEFARRLNDPKADPVETAAWAEWHLNNNHEYADGVGKTMRAVAAIPLMRAGLPLPRYGDNTQYNSFANSAPPPHPDRPDGNMGKAWDRFLQYYRSLMPGGNSPSPNDSLAKAIAQARINPGALTPTEVSRHISTISRLAPPQAVALASKLTGTPNIRRRSDAIEAIRSALGAVGSFRSNKNATQAPPAAPDITAESAPPSSADLEAGELGEHLHPNVHTRTVNGKKWVLKGRNGKGDAVANESLASKLARSIGLNVPQVHPVKMYGQDHAAVEHVEGTSLVRMTPDQRRTALAKVPKEEIDRHALFDYLVGNRDPNNGNYMVTPDGKFTAIDKEQTLSQGIGRGASYRIPFFLEDAQAGAKVAGDYQFHPDSLSAMVEHGRGMAEQLRSAGRTADANGVERRTAVLEKLASEGKPVTALQLSDVGRLHDTNSPPPHLLARIAETLGSKWAAFRGKK